MKTFSILFTLLLSLLFLSCSDSDGSAVTGADLFDMMEEPGSIETSTFITQESEYNAYRFIISLENFISDVESYHIESLVFNNNDVEVISIENNHAVINLPNITPGTTYTYTMRVKFNKEDNSSFTRTYNSTIKMVSRITSYSTTPAEDSPDFSIFTHDITYNWEMGVNNQATVGIIRSYNEEDDTDDHHFYDIPSSARSFTFKKNCVTEYTGSSWGAMIHSFNYEIKDKNILIFDTLVYNFNKSSLKHQSIDKQTRRDLISYILKHQ